MITVEDHPGMTFSATKMWRYKIHNTNTRAIKIEIQPNEMANLNGFLEKPKSPTEAKRIILVKVYFVSPALRSSLS